MKSFWHDLPRPFTILAPMEGVTDIVFRQIITEIGRPEVFFTEFTSCTGLLSTGNEKVAESLKFSKDQKPIIAQIWGTVPEEFYKIAKKISKQGFSGIDINMGCPVRAVTKHGACGGLIRTPELAVEIVKATIDGAGGLPVSVKTRIGFSHADLDGWIGLLLGLKLDALTVHLRTVSEMSKAPAHWELMPQIIEMRNKIAPSTIIIGNGDMNSLSDVEEKYKKFGADGYMIGTGIFANPWLFNKDVNMLEKTLPERIDLYLHHIDLFEKQWGSERNFASLKKFAKTYISNISDSASLRESLMETKSLDELKSKLKNFKD